MSFDWSHYLDLAQELLGRAPGTLLEDANLRSSISRAYYAAFHKARLRLYDKWNVSIPTNASAHAKVRVEFKKRKQKYIAITLNRMRIDRNKADYDDSIINLPFTANENLKRANKIISNLSSL
jgi:uncharacterized protein (UPF0332 family)